MRPAGEIRQALRECFPSEGQGVATWHDALQALGQRRLVNPAAPGERRLVRQTVENMVQAGELRRAAPTRRPGSRRPMMGYTRGNWATEWGGSSSHGAAALAQVVTAWR